jgi:nicotinic acid mononucleotide adenylyltransferase
MAKDHFSSSSQYELIAGYFSPVSDGYMKEGLAPAKDRVAMCQLAVDCTSDWLMVDDWEARQPMYQPTADVLDHFERELNGNGGIGGKKIKIMLLAGGDLIASFGHPTVWTSQDVSGRLLVKVYSFMCFFSCIVLSVLMVVLLLNELVQTFMAFCYLMIYFTNIG